MIELNQEFGRWTVIGLSRLRQGGNAYKGALVQCSCVAGTVKMVRQDKLTGGRSRSCGCLRRETTAATGRANAGKPRMAKHSRGASTGHPLYNTWKNILARCENPNCPDYPAYGGRGIRLHDAWHDFAVFVAELEAEIGPRPAEVYLSGFPKYTLDRVNPDSGYDPGNLRWADAGTQARNISKKSELVDKLPSY